MQDKNLHFISFHAYILDLKKHRNRLQSTRTSVLKSCSSFDFALLVPMAMQNNSHLYFDHFFIHKNSSFDLEITIYLSYDQLQKSNSLTIHNFSEYDSSYHESVFEIKISFTKEPFNLIRDQRVVE